jgi:hypothetical protein
MERLRSMPMPMERRDGLGLWDDSHIRSGGLWREEIEKAPASAQVALLLESADCLAADCLSSDFIACNELPPL